MNRNDANFQIGDLGLLEATPEMKAGLEKFDFGDPISDQELTQLMEFYTTLEASLRETHELEHGKRKEQRKSRRRSPEIGG
mgnify:CR=1 FL=1